MLDLGGDVCGNGISKLVFTILSAVAENERDRIRDIKQHNAAKGIYNGGKRQYGFTVVSKGKDRRLVPNEAEQANIARIMELTKHRYMTVRAIARELAMPHMTVRRIIARQQAQ